MTCIKNSLKLVKSLLFAGLVFFSSPAYAEDEFTIPFGEAAPGVKHQLQWIPTYRTLYITIVPYVPSLTQLLEDVVDGPTYVALRTEAYNLAAEIENGRVLVVLPDGIVAVDTLLDPAAGPFVANTFINFEAGTVQPVPLPDGNDFLSILLAQLWPAGVGVEHRRNGIVVHTESDYVAVRLGSYLSSAGTVRLSIPSIVPFVIP